MSTKKALEVKNGEVSHNMVYMWTFSQFCVGLFVTVVLVSLILLIQIKQHTEHAQSIKELKRSVNQLDRDVGSIVEILVEFLGKDEEEIIIDTKLPNGATTRESVGDLEWKLSKTLKMNREGRARRQAKRK